MPESESGSQKLNKGWVDYDWRKGREGVHTSFMVSLLLMLFQASIQEIQADWSLLAYPSVRHELQATDAQNTQAAKAIQRGRFLVKQAASKPPTAEAISEEGLVLRAARPALEALAMTLTPSQLYRLRQITVQQIGPFVATSLELVQALAMSDAAIIKIKDDQAKVFAKYFKKTQDYISKAHPKLIPEKGGGLRPIDSPEFQKLEQQKQAELESAMQFWLTASQKARLKELRGKTFVLPEQEKIG